MSAVQSHYELYTTVTSHAFTPPSSEFGRGLIVISGARLGVATERISHGWVTGSSSERVGMRHEIGFQFQFCRLLKFSQYPVRSLEFSISDLSSFGEEESSIPVSSSAEVGLRRWKASSVELVQSEYFVRSPSVGVDPELVSDVDRVERFRLTLGFFDDASKFSVCSFYVVFIFS